MPKIETSISLPDIMECSGWHRDMNTDKLENYRPDHTGFLKGFTGYVAVKLEEPLGGMDLLLAVLISDINKGRFIGWTDGHLKILKQTYQLAGILSMDDQLQMLRPNGIQRARSEDCAEGDRPFIVTCGGDNTHRKFAFYGPASYDTKLVLYTRHSMYNEDWLRGILSPFVRQDVLQRLVAEIPDPKHDISVNYKQTE